MGYCRTSRPTSSVQADAIEAPAPVDGPGIRDLRGLLWASIDNDDSQDLDQLSVAVPQPDGVVKILVAIADVDAIVKVGSPDRHTRPDQHDIRVHGGTDFPMLPEKPRRI